MKLVDLLVKYLPGWPDGATELGQSNNGDVYTDNDNFVIGLRLASDWASASVTKTQYLAARDRLHAETVKDLPNKTSKKPVFDKSVWLEVAKSEFAAMAESFPELTPWQRAEFAFDAADAFCAEMNKRI